MQTPVVACSAVHHKGARDGEEMKINSAVRSNHTTDDGNPETVSFTRMSRISPVSEPQASTYLYLTPLSFKRVPRQNTLTEWGGYEGKHPYVEFMRC